jgi:Zn-dependent peptidase ImmA (M78 family)
MAPAHNAVTAAHAERVLRDLSMASLPIDPFAIARKHEILVQAKGDARPGISGLLMQVGSSVGIMYATHLANEGYERFSVAHELGHIDALLGEGGIHESQAGFVSGDRYEREADDFAASLLMPRSLFLPALSKAGTGLEAVEQMHTLCKTSLTATAIRVTQLTRDPMAIVVSTGKQIDYCFMSDELKEFRGIDWIRKRQLVPRGTVTFEFNKNPKNVLNSDRTSAESDLQDWFGGNRSVEICEEVVGLGAYGKTLTILHEIDLPDEQDEGEESSRDSWSPKFHR